jgi:sulfhydrogenase subunit alpha
MTKIIKLDHLTKIEGHASLILKIDKGKLKQCDLNSIEGSRYFEGLVKDRIFSEAPEITSRICGICSCAHTLAASMAMESALNIIPSKQTVQLRNLLNWGERIRSHTTHLYFMSLPDFLGYESALAMLAKHKSKVQIGMNLMKTGNDLMAFSGGRDLHPVSAQIGGFLKLPTEKEIKELKLKLERSQQDAIRTIELFTKLKYPNFENQHPSFSLTNKNEYAMLIGEIKAEKSYKKENYKEYLKEYNESDSTANFVVKEGKVYRVGALARINNNQNLLNKKAKKYSKSIKFPSENPFHNNYAQAIEILHGIEECIKILDNLDLKKEKPKTSELKSGQGIAAIEVPRGILFHEYVIKNKRIKYCNIITPTSQNLKTMEIDIKKLVPSLLSEPKEKIVLEVEKLIRAYDPCFSCSTHFLDVTWQ